MTVKELINRLEKFDKNKKVNLFIETTEDNYGEDIEEYFLDIWDSDEEVVINYSFF